MIPDFPAGTRVVFPHPAFGDTRTGTVQERHWSGMDLGYNITADGSKPGPWFILPGDITPIPDDSPILLTDMWVQVNPDAPYYAGRGGYIDAPEVRGDMFGYRLTLFSPREPAWVPAQALTPAPNGGVR